MWAAADTGTNELILSVTADELTMFVTSLLNPEAAHIELEAGPSRPALRRLGAIRVAVGDGPVRVALHEHDASLTGSREGFAHLADAIGAFAEYNDLDEPGMHAHFDPRGYPGGSGVLAHDSVPLIIAGSVPDDRAG